MTSVEIRNPYSGAIVGRVEQAGEVELARAAARAAEAFARWRTAPSWRRAEVLIKIAAALRETREDMARTIVAEAAKPIRDARTEVDRAAQTFTLASEEAKRISGELVPLSTTRIMLVVITDTGRVEQRLVDLPAPIEPELVLDLRQLLNDTLGGLPFIDTTRPIVELCEGARPELRGPMTALATVLLETLAERPEVAVHGPEQGPLLLLAGFGDRVARQPRPFALGSYKPSRSQIHAIGPARRRLSTMSSTPPISGRRVLESLAESLRFQALWVIPATTEAPPTARPKSARTTCICGRFITSGFRTKQPTSTRATC